MSGMDYFVLGISVGAAILALLLMRAHTIERRERRQRLRALMLGRALADSLKPEPPPSGGWKERRPAWTVFNGKETHDD